MSVVAVEGVYKKGKIVLSETPKGVSDSARVIVTFLDGERPDEAEAIRQSAFEQVIADMREGLDLGGSPYPKREDLYGRGKEKITGAA